MNPRGMHLIAYDLEQVNGEPRWFCHADELLEVGIHNALTFDTYYAQRDRPDDE